ncbi:alpha/beta fold hydrolase [Arthrobacter sp. MMS18-M83]|uniref:alpha/beta fold hydrolase n=1 Tax=Arthrobacter sp. MMS18-M83 TaxID=2996261 RepID=UPI00227B81EE|nr:alpha/beta fold hydrolase [Arthrobacter sp. MMS18-M83]WAH97587.1 alpha/beta fold hydrolase [Arthrobacter sp. MMS18-M83]
MTSTLEITSQQVDVGDTTLHVSISGQGFPLVWLHGSGPGASGLSNFQANLEAFPDFRNLVIDHPRFGASGRPHIEGALIPYSGERILKALDALGVQEFSLIGNSYGGGVAAWIAATAPDRVTSLILMAPGGLTPKHVTKSEDLPYGIQLIVKAMTQGVDRELLREFTGAMVYDPALVTDELVEQRYHAAAKNNPEIEGVPHMGDLTELLGNITARTLIIWGREDRFLLPGWAILWLEAISNSELHVFPRCGHWAQYEQLNSFNRLTGEFLRSEIS